MTRLLALTFVLISLASGCAASSGPTQVPPVEGTARTEILTDAQITEAAIKAAETYLNAQKTSDAALFHSVSPHESMSVIFDWAYVNKSDIVVESAPLAGIKGQLMAFSEHYGKYTTLSKLSEYSDGPSRELELAARYADRMEKGGYPMLGNLLQKGYWQAIIPSNLAELDAYRLLNMHYVADVKGQSVRGTVLQKRVTLDLYRMQAADKDSGWKILFVAGL